MEPWQLVLLTGTGVLAGFLNVMAGGGSLLTVPVMVFLDVPGPVANGTNRLAILAQSVTAVTAFFRRGFADFKLSLSLAVCTIPGAIIGAMAGTRLDGPWFNRVLAVIMLGVLLLTLFGGGNQKTEPREYSKPNRKQLIRGHLCMIGIGLYGGFIQLGIGFVIMAVLNRVMGLDLVRTNMHKVFIVMTYTVVALIVFASQIEILWIAGLALAIGNSIGGWVATNVQLDRGEGLIKAVLNVVLVAFIIKLLFFA